MLCGILGRKEWKYVENYDIMQLLTKENTDAVVSEINSISFLIISLDLGICSEQCVQG